VGRVVFPATLHTEKAETVSEPARTVGRAGRTKGSRIVSAAVPH